MLVPEAQGGGSVSEPGLRDLALVAEEHGPPGLAPARWCPVNVVARRWPPAPIAERVRRDLDGPGGRRPGRQLGVPSEAGPTASAPVADRGPATATRSCCSGTKAPGRGGRPGRPAAGDRHGATAARCRSWSRRRRPASPSRRASASTSSGASPPSPSTTSRCPAAAVVERRRGRRPAVERQLQIGRGAADVAETVGAIDRVFEFTVEWRLRPLLLRPAAGVLPGAQAPLRRHEAVAGGEPRPRRRRPPRGRGRRATTPPSW